MEKICLFSLSGGGWYPFSVKHDDLWNTLGNLLESHPLVKKAVKWFKARGFIYLLTTFSILFIGRRLDVAQVRQTASGCSLWISIGCFHTSTKKRHLQLSGISAYAQIRFCSAKIYNSDKLGRQNKTNEINNYACCWQGLSFLAGAHATSIA